MRGEDARVDLGHKTSADCAIRLATTRKRERGEREGAASPELARAARITGGGWRRFEPKSAQPGGDGEPRGGGFGGGGRGA